MRSLFDLQGSVIADGLILVDGQPDIIDGFTIQFCAEQRG